VPLAPGAPSVVEDRAGAAYPSGEFEEVGGTTRKLLLVLFIVLGASLVFAIPAAATGSDVCGLGADASAAAGPSLGAFVSGAAANRG
jgi:hypothetical protein